MQIPPFINREEATRNLEEISSRLRTWEAHKNTDSKTIETFRRQDLQLSQEGFRRLHYHLHPALRVDITTGQEETVASYFIKGPYDYYEERLRTLEPGTVVPFERIEEMKWNDQSRSIFYIGRAATMLSMPALASTIATGGNLLVAEADVPVNG